MKKRVILIAAFLILLVINIFHVIAQEDTVSEKAYACLEEKVEDECSSLSTEEKIFSLLAIRECKSELLSDSLQDQCWPKSGCKTKTTAQAILALEEAGESTKDINKSVTWLLSKKGVPDGIDWLLQIETKNSSSCEISYSGSTYTVKIGEDKKLNSGAGSCLSLYGEDYWLKISSKCFDNEFEVSCDSSFSTTLLYKEKSSSIVYVSEEVNSASADGRTFEEVNSFCFVQGNDCDYEASLWAALALESMGYDTSLYIPYLVTGLEANQRYLPEAFLYILLGDSYRTDILIRQRENKYWVESGDKYYDTAVALYPFQYEEISEKINAIGWLEEVQGSDGCWQSNIRNTAFILYSLWPKSYSDTSTSTEEDCEDSGYFCMSRASCEDIGGDVLEDYEGCFGAINICCTKEKELESCEEQGGIICDDDEVCIDGEDISAPDLSYGETCCLGGDCELKIVESECEVYGGNCRNSCFSDEEETTDYECLDNDICCFEKEVEPKPKYLWIIILSVLIVLVALGIVFRKKLKKLLSKLKKGRKSKSGKRGKRGPGRPPGPGMPRGFPPPPGMRPGMLPRRIMPRKILPSSSQPVKKPRQPVKKPGPKPKRKKEIEDVLKKLREIGK